MSFSPEFEILREYLNKRNLLLSSTKGRISQKDQDELMAKLQHKYAELLSIRQSKIRSDLNLRVRTLHKRLEDIFELLALW